jgi:glycine cleavage system aminomethyltransferase T
MRDRVAISDISAHGILDLVGPGATATAERLVEAPIDGLDGTVVDTWMLDPTGAVVSEVTVIRIGPDHVRLVTAPGRHHRDRTWIADHLGDGTSLLNETSGRCGVRLLGPAADALAEAVGLGRPDATDDDRVRRAEVGPVPVLAVRRSLLGEPGWELHAPAAMGLALWDRLWEAGRPLGLVAVGTGVTRTTARLEAGLPAIGSEFSGGRGLVEAGLVVEGGGAAGQGVKTADFIGREATLARLERPPATMLVTLVVDDDRSATGERRSLMGGEPLSDASGQPIVDASGRQALVTSAANAPSLGRQLLMAFVPPEAASIGSRLQAEYFGERYPATVIAVGASAGRLSVPEAIA